jgi:hypothetical protein
LTCWTIVVLAKFFIRELSLGQTNALLGVLLLPSVIEPSRHPRLAGALAGAAIFVKPYAVILLPWLLLTQRVSAWAAWAAAVAIGLLLPVALYGWTGNLHLLADWYRTVTDTTAPNMLHPDNVSILSMWAKWIGAGPPSTWISIAIIVAVVLNFCAAMIGRDRMSQPAYLECGALMLAMPLLSPQGWDYLLLLGAPLVVLAIDRWRELPMAWRFATGAAGFIFALPLRQFTSTDTYNYMMAAPFVTGAALVLVALATDLRRRHLA